jgi:hypothetical protein
VLGGVYSNLYWVLVDHVSGHVESVSFASSEWRTVLGEERT